MMRGLSSSLFRWLTAAACGSRYFRRDEVEFPVASQRVCDLWTVRGSRVTDGASIGALRPFNHSLNINHKHELSFLRETPAPFARRTPTQRRSRRLPGKSARESTKENILAAVGCIFRERQKRKETCNCVAQWRAASAVVAQT
jgi:hypothetical protein